MSDTLLVLSGSPVGKIAVGHNCLDVLFHFEGVIKGQGKSLQRLFDGGINGFLLFGVQREIDLEVECHKDGVGLCIFFQIFVLVESIVPIIDLMVKMFFD